jgi:hypothetical protein
MNAVSLDEFDVAVRRADGHCCRGSEPLGYCTFTKAVPPSSWRQATVKEARGSGSLDSHTQIKRLKTTLSTRALWWPEVVGGRCRQWSAMGFPELVACHDLHERR